LVILAALASLGIAAYLASQLSAQQPGGGGAAAAPASVKVGMVNLAFVLKNYKKFTTYNDTIENIRKDFEAKDAKLRDLLKQWQAFQSDPKATAADREKAEDTIKTLKRQIEDNGTEYNKVRSKKSDEQMVQMYKEVEAAVSRFAVANGFHMIFHFSEPLTDADKYSPPNIQRKLVGPGQSGGVCPLYVNGALDVSADVVATLNSMFPAPPGAAVTPASGQK
jgi:Skp family chaperone for outer membrane proteins